MMKKEKTLRMAVTGALLLTVVAAGISMYRTDTTPKKESKAQQEQAMQEDRIPENWQRISQKIRKRLRRRP